MDVLSWEKSNVNVLSRGGEGNMNVLSWGKHDVDVLSLDNVDVPSSKLTPKRNEATTTAATKTETKEILPEDNHTRHRSLNQLHERGRNSEVPVHLSTPRGWNRVIFKQRISTKSALIQSL